MNMIEAYEDFQRTKMKVEPSWGKIPPRMRDGIAAYIMQGRRTGSFLHALFSNDLCMAVGHADSENQHLLQEYVHFMYIHFPVGAYGSERAVAAWKLSGGILGQEAAIVEEAKDAAPSGCPHCGYRHPPDGMCLS